ncbi:MAG: triose-phosphate isomerase [Bacteroidota bacterium]
MRKKILAANWKMNLSLQEAKELFIKFNSLLPQADNIDYYIFSPSIFLHELRVVKGKLILGAQNFYPEKSGAFTGEISISQLIDAQVNAVLIGHSERRMLFNESDELIKQKVDFSLQNGFNVIFCCGESIEIRNKKEHINFVRNQLEVVFSHIKAPDFSKCVIAYEPIWAIGSGRTANEKEIEEMHSAIRNWILKKYDVSTSQNISILYGGSCNGKNAKSIFSCPNVDGGLIGGASLTFESFNEIANKLQV